MRTALRLLLPLVILAGPLQGQASAVTIKELLEYKAKLSDDILIALIESDGSVFRLTISDVAALRDQGLSERVILAMLKTAIKPPTSTPSSTQPPTTPPAGAPGYTPTGGTGDSSQSISVSADAPDQTQPRAPVVVNVRQEVTQHVDQPAMESQPTYSTYGYPFGYSFGYTFSPYAYVVSTPVRSMAPPPAPVYWGWGGQRRPDSWLPSPPPPPQQNQNPKPNPLVGSTLATPKPGGGV